VLAEANLALVELAARFIGTEAVFLSTLTIRIRGAITDLLRKLDPLNRHQRATITAYFEYTEKHQQASLEETASTIDCSTDFLRTSLISYHAAYGNSKEKKSHCPAYNTPDDKPSPEDILIMRERRKIKNAALAVACGPEAASIYRLYESDKKLTEIGAIKGFSESNAGQLLIQAKKCMREWINKNIKP